MTIGRTFLVDTIYSILRVPILRFILVQARLRFFIMVRGLRKYTSHGSVPVTIEHNLKSLGSFNTRNENLFLCCMVIEDIQDAETLVVGCRTEEEYYLLKSYGVRSVELLDLISYSSKVRLGDMHALPYEDNSFGFIFISYTISYSRNPRIVAAELLRVVRNAGHIAVAIEYAPWNLREDIQEGLLGYTISSDTKLENAQDILDLFGSSVGDVIVRYDAVKKRHHSKSSRVAKPSPVSVVFSVTK